MDSNGQTAVMDRPVVSTTPEGVLDDLDDVARLYREEAVRIRKLVRMHVVASSALVEDACQIAWCRLLIHRARVRRESARAWLVQVAVHEALKAIAREGRERSLEALQERDRRPDRGVEPAIASTLTPTLIEDLVEQRARLDSVRALPDRQRRLVWLQGLGLSYREMAGETGMTRRTVERQLMRARVSLSKAGA
ncbi:MAG TPA: sigma-70 family RNA polymerase sigma factor [Solirubrobacteraceae bacterium]|nr:sigma-70 family RNA polymerase sigma factor [Solirubrobacteraceae bacterium]